MNDQQTNMNTPQKISLPDVSIAKVTDLYETVRDTASQVTDAGESLLGDYSKLTTLEEKGAWNTRAISFLSKVKKAHAELIEERKQITKPFDAIKSAFTEVEGVISSSGDIPSKVLSKCNEYASLVRLENEKAARAAQLVAERAQNFEKAKAEVKKVAFSLANDVIVEIKDAAFMAAEKGDEIVMKDAKFYADEVVSRFTACIDDKLKNIGFQFSLSDEDMAQVFVSSTRGAIYSDVLNMIIDAIFSIRESAKLYRSDAAKFNAAATANIVEAADATEKKIEAESVDGVMQSYLSAPLAELKEEPKSRSSKVIKITSKEGLAAVISFWVANAIGDDMDMDKVLNTKISSMLVFAQREYSKNNTLIQSSGLSYVDKVTTVI